MVFDGVQVASGTENGHSKGVYEETGDGVGGHVGGHYAGELCSDDTDCENREYEFHGHSGRQFVEESGEDEDARDGQEARVGEDEDRSVDVPDGPSADDVVPGARVLADVPREPPLAVEPAVGESQHFRPPVEPGV